MCISSFYDDAEQARQSDAEGILAELSYISYKTNRELGVAPERLVARKFKDAAQHEQRYMREKV